MPTFLITMPEGWTWHKCYFCIKEEDGNLCDNKPCPLSIAVKAVEVSASGIGTGVIPRTPEPTFMYKDKSPQAIDKPVKLWATEIKE